MRPPLYIIVSHLVVKADKFWLHLLVKVQYIGKGHFNFFPSNVLLHVEFVLFCYCDSK